MSNVIKKSPEFLKRLESSLSSDPSDGSSIDSAIRDRDAYFAEAARTKETLAEIIPALEVASKCKADELRETCPDTNLIPDEWAALWMARAILEVDSLNKPETPNLE